MDLKEQAPVTTLARRLAAPAHVSGLAIRLARLSGAAERLPEWLLKVAVERGAAHYHPGNSSSVPRRPAQSPGAGEASRTCDSLILTPFPAMPTPASAAEAFPYNVFLSHSAKDKAAVRPLAERLRQDGLTPNAKGQRLKDKVEVQPSASILQPFLDAPIKGSLALALLPRLRESETLRSLAPQLHS